jgi:hypothetical protein
VSYIILHNKKSRGRYYALVWTPALTGGWAVERAWGPLRARRRQRKSNFANGQEDALDFVAHHLRRRFQHGYTVQGASPEGYALVKRILSKEDHR